MVIYSISSSPSDVERNYSEVPIRDIVMYYAVKVYNEAFEID